VVAETEREALEIARRGYDKWRTSFLKLWKMHGRMPIMHAVFPERFEDAEAEGRAVAGSADKVAAFLLREVKAGGLNYLLCRFAFGDITGAESLHSLDLFVRHVMPALAAHEGNT
jgi:alkanesulfonate monooxygenase SsuD/methylene tetrahydromethanopterin reductase-like flavin-dependent oxidoreductase (luciferase family)